MLAYGTHLIPTFDFHQRLNFHHDSRPSNILFCQLTQIKRACYYFRASYDTHIEDQLFATLAKKLRKVFLFIE